MGLDEWLSYTREPIHRNWVAMVSSHMCQAVCNAVEPAGHVWNVDYTIMNSRLLKQYNKRKSLMIGAPGVDQPTRDRPKPNRLRLNLADGSRPR